MNVDNVVSVFLVVNIYLQVAEILKMQNSSTLI